MKYIDIRYIKNSKYDLILILKKINITRLHCKLLTILRIIFIAIYLKSILYITRTDLEKRMCHVHTSILLKLGGPLQLVVVLV